MPVKKVRPADEIKESIAAKSERVREAASEITDRITRFEEFLAKMPGRTEALHVIRDPNAHDEDDMAAFGLKVHRVNKEWIISYAEYEIDDAQSANWKRLSEASLRTKLTAIKMFPDLLAAIEDSQDELVKEIEQAGSDFDKFAAKLGMKGGA